MRLGKTITQVLILCLVLLEIRFVIRLFYSTWFFLSESFDLVGLELVLGEVALVYLFGLWIKQLNIYYRKKD